MEEEERSAVLEKCIDSHTSFSNILFTLQDCIGQHRDLLSPSEHILPNINYPLKIKVALYGFIHGTFSNTGHGL